MAPMIRRLQVFSFAMLTSLAAAQARPLPPLEDATSVWDTAAGAPLVWTGLLDRLAKLDAVFLGETHVDDTTHRVELHVLQQLLARRPGKVVLSMEMFERDVQGALDDYLQGRIDEAAFLGKARPWSNYRTAYRPLVEAAKAAGIPVVAANFPAGLRRKLAQGGKQAIDALSEAERALMPADIFPASDAYWERVERAVRGHMGGGSNTPEERLYDAQNLWDNAMGDAVAKAKAAHPDAVVLHVAGGFHVAYRDGTVAQFARRSAKSTSAVVEIAPTSELHFARPDRDRDQADFLVYARTLSREHDDGTWAVEVPAELRYQLEVPKSGVDWPLLVWLPDRGSRPDDSLAYWRTTAGGEVAIAVVHQPFPELQDDLALGGRYAFGDGFRADYTRVSHGIARIVEYVTRKFAVDAKKVVVAGAGDGGAAVLWTSLYGEWLDAEFFALEPNDLARLAMEALPDQKPVARSLTIVGSNTERFESIAADYKKVGVPTRVLQSPSSQQRSLVHLALATSRSPQTAPGGTGPVLLLLDSDTPRAREWAELHASAFEAKGSATRIEITAKVPSGTAADRVVHLAVGGEGKWAVASFGKGDGIPLAGGPFGGTTIVVLPKGTSDADRAAWLEHEKNKVLKRRSMFANIAVASADGEPSLASVITTLRQKGRSRFLIVPAMFCADAAAMQALKQQLGTAADGLDVAWLPGLGAALASDER